MNGEFESKSTLFDTKLPFQKQNNLNCRVDGNIYLFLKKERKLPKSYIGREKALKSLLILNKLQASVDITSRSINVQRNGLTTPRFGCRDPNTVVFGVILDTAF